MKTKILLVAGYNYSGNYDYELPCKNRYNYLLYSKPEWQTDSSVEFILFSFKKGTISKNNFKNGIRQWEVVDDSFSPISKSYYEEKSFKQDDTEVMSITDVYNYVYEIGRTEPHSILEVSIMSHAYFYGPILVNSDQRADYTFSGSSNNHRDPWDKDGRTKDFNLVNMKLKDRINYWRAFQKGGCYWVWGCTFPRMLYSILYQTFSKNRKARVANYNDSDMIQFSYRQTQANDYYQLVPIFFPSTKGDGTVAKSDLKFSRSFGEIIELFKTLVLYSYPGLTAYNTLIPCRAAFIGTWTEPERGPARKQHRQMEVKRDERPFPQIIDFFQLHLGLKQDPENRGFAIFDPVTMHTWWQEFRAVV